MRQRTPKVPVEERARRYCAKLDPTQCGTQSCHPKTFQVACVLCQAFALSAGEALPILSDWAARGTHRWTEAELRHKIQSALAEPGYKGREGLMERGCFLKKSELHQQIRNRKNDKPPTPEELEEEKAKRAAAKADRDRKLSFDREQLRAAAGDWREVVNLVWLANRSAMDPAVVTSTGYLSALYKPGEKVIVMDRYDDGFLWPDEALPQTGRDGVKMLANPVDGQYRPNPRGKPGKDGQVPPSRRIVECVTSFRFLVLESDRADLRDWLGFLVQVPLRIAAIYTSGGRSIHTLVRLDCRSRTEYEQEKAKMAAFLGGVRIFGVDPGPMQPLAPTRLPGCWREGKSVEEQRPDGTKKYGFFPFKKGPKLQKLLYLQPNPDGRPICELPAVRDVEATWLGIAGLGISDADETAGAGVLAALAYYANTSKPCLEALRKLREEVA